MNKLTASCQCWAAIEQLLVGTALPDERIDAVRADCIRIIGEAIGGKIPEVVIVSEESSRRRGGQRAREQGHRVHPNKAELGSTSPAKPSKTTVSVHRPLPFPVTVEGDVDEAQLKQLRALPVPAARRSAPIDAYLTKTLAIMLERSCGYSGDDEVGYADHSGSTQTR